VPKEFAAPQPNKRAVNMMFSIHALFLKLSIWENIAFGLENARLTKAIRRAR